VDLRSRSAFDFDGPEFSAGEREKKVNLSSIGGSIVVCFGSVWGRGDQSFKYKTLPGLANDRVTEQSFLIANAEQCVCDSAIAHIHLRGLHKASAGIPMP